MDLFTCNHRGLLPLEKEEKEAFDLRIASLPTVNFGYHEALLHCKRLFDLEPHWVPIIQSQKDLAPWQAAVLWIQEKAPLIQLSPWLEKPFFQKFYAKDEILAHELIHAVRLPLNSSRFEEIIAYQTSSNSLRRYFGPLFRRPYEVYVLLIALVCGWGGLLWPYAFFIPWIFCYFGLGRLFLTQRIFQRAKNKLSKILTDKSKALAVMARLTDKEITLFARSSPEEINDYISEAKKSQLRWQMLSSVYLT